MPFPTALRTPWHASIVTRITLLFALLLVGVVALMGWISWRASRTELIARSHGAIDHMLDVAVTRLQSDELSLLESLDMLATCPAVREWCTQIDTRDPQGQQRARERVAAFLDPVLRSRSRFAQIRLLGPDTPGMEVVRAERIGGDVRITPDSSLQAKGDRDYYGKTMAAAPGTRLSFPIDLNQEHGSFQVPRAPTLRVSARSSPPGENAPGW